MDWIMFMEQAQEALERFNAAEYAVVFQQLEKESVPLFDALDEPDTEAQTLLDTLDARRQALGRREQKRALDREKLALALFLSPAAERRGGNAIQFSQQLNRLWNERHPKSIYKPGSFDAIMSGFQASFLGIPLNNFVRRR